MSTERFSTRRTKATSLLNIKGPPNSISTRSLSSRRVAGGSKKNVERLHEIFAKDGCHRLDIRNHITAVVSRTNLQRACQATGLTLEELKYRPQQYPRLCFHRPQVQCLHGQYRIKAAEDFLSPSDRWWTVDLYLDDISSDLRNALVDEYANEKLPTDGEVYRKIRQYQHESNALFQNRWWSRLSPNKAKRLRRLTSPDNIYLCAAFDVLLAIPGLWNGMSLGSLNTVMALKCDKEVIHYLRHVKNFRATLVHEDPAQMARIDLHTVDTLQLYAPRVSTVDRKIVKGKILSGEVFSNFSRSERVAIWETLRSHETCDGLIASLHTFFRDLSYLEVCAHAVRRLVALNKQHPTIRRALVHSFRPRAADTDCPIQTSETTFRRQAGSTDERLSFAYRQIWMYAMRHYPDMAKHIQSGQAANAARAKARAKANESVIHNMATLARMTARAALLQARKPDHYHYDPDTFESLIDQIAGCFALAIPNEGPPTTLPAGRATKLKDRCGIPPGQAQLLDRPHLFLDQLRSAATTQRNPSSLGVRRSVYCAFFGKPSSQHLCRTLRPPGHQPASLLRLCLFHVTTHAEREPFPDDMSIISLSDGPSIRHQGRSEAREEQLEGRQNPRQGQSPAWRPAAMHSQSGAREPSPASSAGRRSHLPVGVTTDHGDSSDADDQPATSGKGEGAAGEDDCTEIDENELLHRAEGEDPRPRGLPTYFDSWNIRRKGSVGRIRRECCWGTTPARADQYDRHAHQEQPYDPAQRGNRCAARTVSPDADRAPSGNSTDPGASAEHRPGSEPLQAIEEPAGLEQPTEEAHALNEDGTATGAPQRDFAGNDARQLAQTEQPESRNHEGDEPASSQIPPSDGAEGISGEQVTQGRESIADQVEELLREERHAQEQADTPAQLGASQAHAVARRVTEIPADLPSLIAQLREGSQLDAGVPLAHATSVARPEDEASLRPLPLEPIAQSTEEGRLGSDLGHTNLPRSPRRGPRTGLQPRQPGAVRKLRKNQATPTREINRASTRDAAFADELWGSDEGGDEARGITAETTVVSPQDAERCPAVLPDPEQAQREAIARQEGEGLLFNTPHMMQEAADTEMEDLEDRTPAAATRRTRKVTKPPRIAKPKQAQPGGSSKVSRAGTGVRDVAHHEANDPAPLAEGGINRGPAGSSSPEGRVTITVRAYQRGEWIVTDAVSMDSLNPVKAQAIAERGRGPVFRAAIDDGSFTVLMSLGRGLAVTRGLVASVTQLRENVGMAGPATEDEEL
ncbi:uncharacterized protein BO97DRAFT_445522 [Aspergillus homomorphus CBS 101889]|uniref:Uncharacterized protein n=1 Tax=Aspergillus homomorphus (strain CBS 101889) TaxID=1450537 RepID=A0A395HND7_ASPHC|nr:hypothetical protein BO97DRAFT_445522 [Aspergillus homomorphus CBS 101889]RAL09441.1 hypothetical protein BO97DRAFT_445522 [Aspergillus homomorphus CBS 101889]